LAAATTAGCVACRPASRCGRTASCRDPPKRAIGRERWARPSLAHSIDSYGQRRPSVFRAVCHGPAPASLVRACVSRSLAVSAVCLVERRLADCAIELSVCFRAVVRFAAASADLVVGLCDVWGFVWVHRVEVAERITPSPALPARGRESYW
jgi:hypothetical protein